MNRARVTGIGGIFFKARDPAALAAWYREQLGVPLDDGATYTVFPGAPAADVVWSTFPTDSDYFGPGPAGWMINYRVADLDAMRAQLRAAGAWVSDDVQEGDFGRFGWAADPEGNRFELWQPPPADASPPPTT